jgi:peptidoglycan hydrolase-like protein with peptidoglycan-binding domain
MSKLAQKLASAGIAAITVVSLSGVAPVFAQSTADLQAQIASLLAQIQALQAQLAAAQGGSVPATTSFTRDLTVGSTGSDVKALQQWLNANGYTVAASGVGSSGNETTYFGTLTKNAVAKYQLAKGITPPAGYFGPKTRASVGAVAVGAGTTAPVVVVPAGTDLNVSLASDTPPARTIGSGTAFNPALKVALTTGAKAVNVTSIKLAKSGFVANTNLNGVDIVDSKGVRHGQVVTSVNADNSILILMQSDPIAIPANSTEYILVRFNLLSGSITGTVSFGIGAVGDITADTTAIAGAFPITGGIMNIVSGSSSLASTTLDVLTSTGSSSLSVNATDLQEITKFRIQEGSSNEGVNLYSLTLYNAGTAADSSYRDVTLIAPDGSTVLATAQPSDKTVKFVLATPYFIDKGQTKDFTVKAKLVDGAAQTINFEVYNNYDIDLRGASTLVSLIPGAGSTDTTFPIGSGFNIQTIGSGTLTQNKASDSPSSAVVPSSTGVVLAKYTLRPTGESYELRQVSFYIATSTTYASAHALSGTVYVKVNDAIVYSVGASSVSNSTSTTYTLSSYPVISSGMDSTVTITADISSSATASDTYTVSQFYIVTAKRITTKDIVTNPTSAQNANQIAVKAAALTVTTLPTPVANSVVVGTTQYEYATIQLSAAAGGEDVKVSKIRIATGSGNLTEVQNLYLYQDNQTSPLSTSASTATNDATVDFNFTTPILVTRATPVTLHLKADAISGSNAHAFYAASSTAFTAVGAVTGNSLAIGTDITFTGTGQDQTHVSVGQLSVSNYSGSDGSPSANQVVSVGTQGQTLFAFTLRSQYELQKITKIQFYATSSVDNGIATTTLTNVKLYEGNSSTPFYTITTPACQATSTYCLWATDQVSDNLLSAPVPTTGVTIRVKADIGAGGTAVLGNSFKFMMVSSTTDILTRGAVTGQTTASHAGAPAASGISYVVPQQVLVEAVSPLTATQLGSTGSGFGATTVGVFKVTNYGTAPIRLGTSTTFKFNQGGNATTTFHLYVSAKNGTQNDASLLLDSGATSTQAGYVMFNLATSSPTNRTIDGGGWRYLSIKTTGTTPSGVTTQFSVNALGQLTFQADESDLGYNYDAVTGALDSTAQGLYIDGLPSLATITAL